MPSLGNQKYSIWRQITSNETVKQPRQYNSLSGGTRSRCHGDKPGSHLVHGRPQKFFRAGALLTFSLSFSGCWQCNANGLSENALTSVPKAQIKCPAVLRQQSQKCDSLAAIIKHIRIIYTIGHRVSVDFQSRAVIFKEALPWSLPKEALSWSLTKQQIFVTLFLPSKICQGRFKTRAANVWNLVKSGKCLWKHSEIISEP